MGPRIERRRARCARWLLYPLIAVSACTLAGLVSAAPSKTALALAPAKTIYRIVPLWETGSLLQPEINDKDQVAFSVPGPGGAGGRAKFYDGRRVHDIGTLGGAQSFAPGLNDRQGRPVQWRRKGGMLDLGAGMAGLGGTNIGAGGLHSQVRDINDNGLAVGIDTATGSEIGYVWTRETGIRYFPDLAGGRNASPFAVNKRGQVVGATSTGAFAWTRAGGLVDLNTRIPDAPPGLTVTVAHDISDNGAIVADSTSGLVLLVPRAVADVAPVIGSIKIIGPAAPKQLLGFSAGFRDADLRDTHKATWSWGDGTQGPGVVSEGSRNGGGTGSVSGQHAWRAPGAYTVRLTVTDSSGRSTAVTRMMLVAE